MFLSRLASFQYFARWKVPLMGDIQLKIFFLCTLILNILCLLTKWTVSDQFCGSSSCSIGSSWSYNITHEFLTISWRPLKSQLVSVQSQAQWQQAQQRSELNSACTKGLIPNIESQQPRMLQGQGQIGFLWMCINHLQMMSSSHGPWKIELNHCLGKVIRATFISY